MKKTTTAEAAPAVTDRTDKTVNRVIPNFTRTTTGTETAGTGVATGTRITGTDSPTTAVTTAGAERT